MRALMSSSLGRGDVGVVAADDHHRVAPVGHLVEAVDDVGDRGVGILVQLLIAHADALLVGQARGGVRQQQLEDVVAVLAQPGDGPEHPDLGDGGRQPVQDAQRDRRLAGVAFWRGDVDRGWHAANVSAEPAQPRLQILLEELEETALVVPRIVEHQVVEAPLRRTARPFRRPRRGRTRRSSAWRPARWAARRRPSPSRSGRRCCASARRSATAAPRTGCSPAPVLGSVS